METEGGIKVGRSIPGKIRNIAITLSAFLLVGVFGGVEQQTIEAWKLIPAIILIIIMDLAIILIAKVLEIR